MASIYEPPSLSEEIRTRCVNYKRSHRRRYVSVALKAKLAREYNRIYRLKKQEAELRNIKRHQEMQEEAKSRGYVYNPYSKESNVNACTVM